MHRCLSVDEILGLLACELVASGAKAAAAAEDPLLDALWETQNRLTPLLDCFPQDVWDEGSESFVSHSVVDIFSALTVLIGKSFKRIPTRAEWTAFRRYARRIQTPIVDTSEDPVASDMLLTLQLRTANEAFLPRLKTFQCEEATETFIPFIPLFLSHDRNQRRSR